MTVSDIFTACVTLAVIITVIFVLYTRRRTSRKTTRLYRYISPVKVNRYCANSPDFSVEFSPPLIKVTWGRPSMETLTYQLGRALRNLRRAKLIAPFETRSANFLEWSGTCVEFYMNGVVVWLGYEKGATETVFIVGGSAEFLDFDNLQYREIKRIIGGSNLTTYLSACTNFWRAWKGKNGLELLDYVPDHISISDCETEKKYPTVKFDGIPYAPSLFTKDILRAYFHEAAFTYNNASTTIRPNLDMLIVVHIDSNLPPLEEDHGQYGDTGGRIVIGSPLYVAQLTPAS